MALNELEPKSTFEDSFSDVSIDMLEERKHCLPDSFKTGRNAQLQLAKIERDLFSDMEEKGSGKFIIAGLPKKVTELDLTAYSFALGQLLYNQSYLTGNLETNSGISQVISEILSQYTDSTQYKGNIKATLNDICKLAYGTNKPSTEQKMSMEKLIKIVHETPVEIRFPNGRELDSYLCNIVFRQKRPEDGSTEYWLQLNPIFCNNVKKNFSELPQDIMLRLSKVTKKKTVAHLRLVRLISCQCKSKPFSRKIDELINELSLTEAYQKNKGRTEKQLLSVCEDMKSIDLIDNYEVSYSINRGKKSIYKVTFYPSNRDKLLHHAPKTIVLKKKTDGKYGLSTQKKNDEKEGNA